LRTHVVEAMIGTAIEQQYLQRTERSGLHVVSTRIIGSVRLGHHRLGLHLMRMRPLYNRFHQMEQGSALLKYTDSCVINYIMKELSRYERYRSITPRKLIEQLTVINPNFRPPQVIERDWGKKIVAGGEVMFRLFYHKSDARRYVRDVVSALAGNTTGVDPCALDQMFTHHSQLQVFTWMDEGTMRRVHYGQGRVAKRKIDKFVKTIEIEYGLSTDDLFQWAKEYMHYVSIYALTPLFKVFAYHAATTGPKVVLVIVVNNGHCTGTSPM